MDISVIVCTYNRCHNLPECLAALERQEGVQDLAWEVILVDNNSNDQTRSFAQDYLKRAPFNFRYAFCPAQGLSHARNFGIDQAQGRYLAFIDDDIRAAPGWLAAIVATFRAHACDAVGGRIHLDVPLASLPKWIRPEMYGFLGYRDFGEEAYALDGFKEFPFGGNMAIAKSVFARVGLFNPNLGRKGEGRRKDELFKGEETEFFHRLASAGGRIWYQPNALVYHKVLPHQITKRYFLTLHHNAGIQTARLDAQSYARTLWGVPRFVYFLWLKALGRYLWQTFRHGPDFSFRQLMNVAYFTGLIQEYRRRG